MGARSPRDLAASSVVPSAARASDRRRDDGHALLTTVRHCRAWLTAFALIASIVLMSSLIDWFYILPRIGGLGDWPLPCTTETSRDGKRWRFVTQVWYAHRGAAETFSILTLVVTTLSLAATDQPRRVLWSVMATAITSLGVGLGLPRWRTAWDKLLGPDVKVGSVVTAARLAWTPNKPRSTWSTSISAGLQCIFLTAERLQLNGKSSSKTAFTVKEEVSLRHTEDVQPAPSYRPPCIEHCTGINWYCPNNPKAYDPN